MKMMLSMTIFCYYLMMDNQLSITERCVFMLAKRLRYHCVATKYAIPICQLNQIIRHRHRSIWTVCVATCLAENPKEVSSCDPWPVFPETSTRLVLCRTSELRLLRGSKKLIKCAGFDFSRPAKHPTQFMPPASLTKPWLMTLGPDISLSMRRLAKLVPRL